MRFNVCFVGNIAAGKTSIIQRQVTGKFYQETSSTIAVDFANIRTGDFDIAIWDTAGEVCNLFYFYSLYNNVQESSSKF